MYTQRNFSRRGAVAVQVAASSLVLLGMVALTVDIGVVSTARTELQSAADAAALAGADRLLDEDRLKGELQRNAVFAASRQATVDFVNLHRVLGLNLQCDLNGANAPEGDVVLGYLADLRDRTSPLDYVHLSKFNTVTARLRCDGLRNPAIPLTFAPLFGVSMNTIETQATAGFQDGVVGYRIPQRDQTAHLMPLALHRDAWLALLATAATGTRDLYSYNKDSGAVAGGPDGIAELNLYPGAGIGQLPAGNFGTGDIGSPNNSTCDISRQIRYGVNADDLAYFGGELRLGADGTLQLNGDTGLSAAIKDDLESIKGQPRAIPLFVSVAGNGNNAQYTIVGFAGIRVMYVKLTGSMSSKQVIIQPAIVKDSTAIAGVNDDSFYVYKPVMLCR